MRRGTPPRYSTPVNRRRPQPKIPGFIASSLIPPRAQMSDDDAMRRMAEDMREAAYREGGCSADDLEILGFTPEQIRTLSRAAARRAHALSAMT